MYLIQMLWGLLIAAFSGLFTVLNFGLAQSWTATGPPAWPWKSVACSADGTKLIAAGYLWAPDISDSGIPGRIFTSSDSGLTWKQANPPLNYWSSVASSADGTRLVAAALGCYTGDGRIYTSSDSGGTWAQTSAPSNNWASVASSADGEKLVAAAGGASDWPFGPVPIYTSKDSGATWVPTSSPSIFWASVGSSSNGAKLVAAALQQTSSGSPGSIYTSTDSGVTWSRSPAPSKYWRSVACSADGTSLVAAEQDLWSDSGLYTSSDSGATWIQAESPGQFWMAVASSADGTKLVAVADGPIYTLHSPRPPTPLPASPRLEIHISGNQLGLSWLIPSTGFALQENSDLTTADWENMMVAPTLNLTNLHNEISVSPCGGPHFYRLTAQ
jgi:photosystem II stability/assembly factor-like uncharacterized protein